MFGFRGRHGRLSSHISICVVYIYKKEMCLGTAKLELEASNKYHQFLTVRWKGRRRSIKK